MTETMTETKKQIEHLLARNDELQAQLDSISSKEEDRCMKAKSAAELIKVIKDAMDQLKSFDKTMVFAILDNQNPTHADNNIKIIVNVADPMGHLASIMKILDKSFRETIELIEAKGSSDG